VCQEGGFVACFPLNILMVHPPKLTVITDGMHQTDGSFTLGEIVCFRSLKFIIDRFGNLRSRLGTHTILEVSADEGDNL
jgi:hypothetical protein